MAACEHRFGVLGCGAWPSYCCHSCAATHGFEFLPGEACGVSVRCLRWGEGLGGSEQSMNQQLTSELYHAKLQSSLHQATVGDHSEMGQHRLLEIPSW